MEVSEEEPRPTRTLWIGFALLLLMSFGVRLAFIERTLPYSLHIDETSIGKSAARMIRNGNGHPHYFRYPTLPIYVATSSFLIGRIIDGDTESPVGYAGWPFYDRPRVVGTARVIFALLSVGAIAFASLAAARAFRAPKLLILSPLFLSLSGVFLTQSWVYLNVDIVGAFVCSFAVWFMLKQRDCESLMQRAIIPGLLTGLAVGSKFYLGLVGLPFALILMEKRFRKNVLRNGLVIALLTIVGFLLSTPYAVLDFDAFWNGLLTEVRHYGDGNVGRDRVGDAGWPQAVYYLKILRNELGLVTLLAAVFGLVMGWKRNRREFALYLSFPLVLYVFLCTQRVNYPRNLTSTIIFLAPISGYGAIVAWEFVCNAFSRRRTADDEGGSTQREPGKGARLMAAIALALLFMPLLPWASVSVAYSIPRDSRLELESWINANASGATRVLIAEELLVDVRRLEVEFDVKVVPLRDLLSRNMKRRFGKRDTLFVVPTYEPRTRFSAAFAKQLEPVRELSIEAGWGRTPCRLDRNRNIHLGDPSLAVYTLSE